MIYAKEYDFDFRGQFLRKSSDPSTRKGAHVWNKDIDSRWWLGIIGGTVTFADQPFIMRCFDYPGPVKIVLCPELCSIDAADARFSWRLQRRKSGGILDGIRHTAHLLI